MERALSRMHHDDLDAAWRAALRGDVDAALQRISDHVSTQPQKHHGTPWRLTGWLTRKS